jgi:hypothetical protein
LKNPYDPIFDKESNKEARSVFSSLYPHTEMDYLNNLVIPVECTLT